MILSIKLFVLLTIIGRSVRGYEAANSKDMGTVEASFLCFSCLVFICWGGYILINF